MTDDTKKSLAKLRDVARKYPDEFSTCRTVTGHNWQPFEAAWLQDGTIEQTLGCSRCGSRRTQYLDKRGFLLGSNRYSYPEGFALKGFGRLGAEGRALFRIAAVRKLLG